MTSQTTTTRHSRQYSLTSDDMDDKGERKREYNRLAQREFRRRRKEHLKNLEQMQKEQSNEQSEEIERLRYQNDELRRENEALRSQMYGSSASPSHLMASAPLNMSDNRQYSLSPSISGTSISASSPPAGLASDLMSMSSLSLTSSSMLPPSMQSYADASTLSAQPYSMVHQSGLRHANSQSSPESSGFRNSRSSVGSNFQSLNIAAHSALDAPASAGQRRVSSSQSSMVMTPYDRNRARIELLELFRPLYNDPAVATDPQHHLAVLRSMSDSLPSALKPCKAQLETPHFYGIDMVASPSLRERLCTVPAETARSFISDLGILVNERDEVGQIIIWGEDALNEMSWELSQPLLDRWDWLLPGWKQRANFWRRQRGAPLLSEW